MIYVGIDPGIWGAVGMIHPSGYTEVYDAPNCKSGGKTKFDEGRAAMMVEPLSSQGCLVAVEETFMGYKSSQNIGRWMGILAALKIPYIAVSPGTWQRWAGIYGQKGKEPSIRRAQKLWPSLHIGDKEDGKADAMNIADWCMGVKK